MRVVVEMSDTEEGTFEGTVAPPTGDAMPFHGTLELVAVLEAVVSHPDPESHD